MLAYFLIHPQIIGNTFLFFPFFSIRNYASIVLNKSRPSHIFFFKIWSQKNNKKLTEVNMATEKNGMWGQGLCLRNLQ